MAAAAVQAALEAVQAFPGRAGFYWQDLASGEEAEFRGAEPFEAASVIKLPVLVELFRQLETGRPERRSPSPSGRRRSCPPAGR